MKGRRPSAPATTGDDLDPTPPKHFDKHGSRVWRDTIEVLSRAGRPLQEMHREILDGLCAASSDVITSGEILAKEGCCMEGGREGMKRHPASSIRAQALTIKRAYLAELGMTPTSASRLPTQPPKVESNPFDEF